MQPNGSITFGFSPVMLPGFVKPVAIRASLSLPTLNGTWEDNANSSGTFEFNPNCTVGCGGPRTVPAVFDQAPAVTDTATLEALKADIESLKQAIASLALRKDD